MKTAEFGQPFTPRPTGVCRVCGCTDTGDPCNITTTVFADKPVTTKRLCNWADETHTLCDAPDCVKAARCELNTDPAVAEQLTRPYEGKRYGFAPRGRR